MATNHNVDESPHHGLKRFSRRRNEDGAKANTSQQLTDCHLTIDLWLNQ